MSLRALLIGIIGIGIISFVVPWAELVSVNIQIGFLQLAPIVVAMLFLLVLANKLVGLGARRWMLRPQEIAVVYCMFLLGTMVSSRGLMEDLPPTLVGVNYYASDVNQWSTLYFPQIKPWLVPWDPHGPAKQEVAKRFYEGLPASERTSFWRVLSLIPWHLWIWPLLRWSMLVLLVFFAFLCLSVIFRKQWVENEKLTFPLVRLPVEMMREQENSFLSNKLMWIGFLIPTVVFTINGLHNFRPAIPTINLDVDVKAFMLTRPWSDMSFNHMYISFAAIGFFILLPAELLFSFWVFYVLGKLQDVVASAFGLQIQGMPHAAASLHVGYQTVGAFIVLVIYLMIIAWPHLRGVLKRAISNNAPAGEQEVFPYRFAVWGLVLSMLGAMWWCSAMGMSPAFALFYLAVYIFIQGVIMARATTEGGLLMTEGSFAPIDVFALGGSKHLLGANNLTGLGFLDPLFGRDLRGMVFTGFLDSQKLSDEMRVRRRGLVPTFAVAILAAMVIGAVIQIWLPYQRAGVTMSGYWLRNPQQFFTENAPLMRGQSQYYWQAPLFAIIGGAVTALLGFMRVRFYWWPLHPLGYAMCASWTLIVFWFPIFVAWVLKVIIVHYGGLKFFTKVRPFFLGLIFGEFISAMVWALISSVWPGTAPVFPWP